MRGRFQYVDSSLVLLFFALLLNYPFHAVPHASTYLLTVAGVDMVTLHGRIASPPRWVVMRLLFLVRNWLSLGLIRFFCELLYSDFSVTK